MDIPPHLNRRETWRGDGSLSKRVSVMHELQLQADESTIAAVRATSLHLLDCDVWDMVSKKNRLKVSSSLRCEHGQWEAC